MRELRPLYAPVDSASRTIYLPGELAQCDVWFPPVDVPLGAGQVDRPPVLLIRSGAGGVGRGGVTDVCLGIGAGQRSDRGDHAAVVLEVVVVVGDVMFAGVDVLGSDLDA